jgi:TetR/AcrR family transcriptional repressor of mexJK operon
MSRPQGTLDPRKRAAILEAARQVFLTDGTAASIDRVATAANVSKQTVYSHFGSKEELLRAIVAERAAAITEPLVDLVDVSAMPETLRAFGIRFLTVLIAPEVVGLYRLVQSRAADSPDLARIYYEAGPQVSTQKLADYLKRAMTMGAISADNPRTAAEMFIGLLLSQIHLKATLGLAVASAEEIESRVRHAVTIFMKAYGAS